MKKTRNIHHFTSSPRNSSGAFRRSTLNPQPSTCPDSAKTARRPNAVRQRGGLTLLEVLLALTIFGGAMAAMSQLMTVGYRSAVESRLQSQAVIRAEAQMAEVIANPMLLQSASGIPFEEYVTNIKGSWTWSLAVAPWDANANMLALELTVLHTTTDGRVNASFTLRRYIRDPQVLAQEQADEEAAQLEAEGT